VGVTVYISISLFQIFWQVWKDSLVGLNVKPNYLSAAGSFLQSIINGYGGVRLHGDRLDINPILPPGAVDMQITGIDYLGSSINLYVTADKVTLSLTSTRQAAPPLTVYVEEPEQVFKLILNGRSVSFDRRKASITSSTLVLPREPRQWQAAQFAVHIGAA